MCLKNMTAGMVPWYGLTVPWLKVEKVWFMSSCTPFINRTIIEEVQCFREGNHQDWRGIQISILVCHSIFSNNQRAASNATCSNLTFFQTHLPYLGDCVHFLGINYAHNSNSNNRCMKRCTRTVWKTMLVLFSTFSCLLQGMGRYFKEMCGNSQP